MICLKKCKFFFIVLTLCTFILVTNVFAANPPLDIDIEALQNEEGTADIHTFDAAGYGFFILQMGKIGDYQCLGEIDLSKYDTVTIRYGADQGAQFYDDEKSAWLALTTNGPTTDSSYNPIEGVEVITKVDVENPYGNWAQADNEVVMQLDSDYNGVVYLAFTMAKIGDRQDGIAITEIIFSDSSYEPPTPEPTEEPTPTPEPTDTPEPTKSSTPTTEKDDGNNLLPIIIGSALGVVVIVAIIVVVIKRKK